MEQNNSASSRGIARLLIALAIFGATFLTVTGAAGLYCFFAPRVYFSKVTIEAEPLEAKASLSTFNPYPNFRDHLQALQTDQLKGILKKEVLYPVIDNLKLVEDWSKRQGTSLSKDEVYSQLVKSIELSRVRNTDLIQIGVSSPDPQEAANIANMIAVIYKEVNQEDQLRDREAVLAHLRDVVVKQKKSVETARMELVKLREKEGITDPNPESNATNFQGQAQSQEYINSKNRYLNAKKSLEEAEKWLSPQTVQLKMAITSVKILEKAEPAMRPSKPHVIMIMGGASVIGFLFGLAFSLIYLMWAFRNPKSLVTV